VLLECVLKMKAPAVKILIEASRKPGTITVRIPTCIYALYVLKREELMLMKVHGCRFDILTDIAIHDCGERRDASSIT
jgi:hypothetical protein